MLDHACVVLFHKERLQIKSLLKMVSARSIHQLIIMHRALVLPVFCVSVISPLATALPVNTTLPPIRNQLDGNSSTLCGVHGCNTTAESDKIPVNDSKSPAVIGPWLKNDKGTSNSPTTAIMEADSSAESGGNNTIEEGRYLLPSINSSRDENNNSSEQIEAVNYENINITSYGKSNMATDTHGDYMYEHYKSSAKTGLSTMPQSIGEAAHDSPEGSSSERNSIYATSQEDLAVTEGHSMSDDANQTENDEDDPDKADVSKNEYANDRGLFENEHRLIHQPMTNHLGHGRVYAPHEVHGLIWEERHYMLSVLIPITCGILGAMLIVCVAYGLRNCNTDNSHMHHHRQVSHLSAIKRRARAAQAIRSHRRRPRIDHSLLLGNSSDEECGHR